MKAARFRRRLVSAMLVVYTGFVLLITLTPRMPGTGLVSRVVHRFLYELREHGITNIHFLDIEFFGNILMFVPLGVFAALLVPRRAWWTLLFMGTAFSGVIEASQAAFLPDRFPEVRDLISNTTGFLIGAVVSVALRLLVAHRDGLVEQDRRRAESLARR
ncbi:MAG: VanZ family protein [Microbacteriaceae bacterium]|jgi:glycopeptide antibiotics resistance protein|nr:VanZ family protein [Microbacteriaceae bacterium]